MQKATPECLRPCYPMRGSIDSSHQRNGVNCLVIHGHSEVQRKCSVHKLYNYEYFTKKQATTTSQN